MRRYIDAAALRASSEAVRVLVSPLQFASEADWRAAVHETLRTLFFADHTMSIMAGSARWCVPKTWTNPPSGL